MLLAVLMETMSMSYVIPAAGCDLNLTLSDKGTLSAISFLGKWLLKINFNIIKYKKDKRGRKFCPSNGVDSTFLIHLKK